MKVGLFFGSFNPIHIGHLAIANYFKEFTDLNEIWFVVSPQNPLKKKSTLLDQQQRVDMVKLALAGELGYRVEDFEKQLPTPSYTYQSLIYLKEAYPENEFVLIIGGDNLDLFQHWRNWQDILEMLAVYVYPRSGTEVKLGNMKLVPAPIIEISSSQIRQWIQQKKTIPFMMTPDVQQYIRKNKLYI